MSTPEFNDTVFGTQQVSGQLTFDAEGILPILQQKPFYSKNLLVHLGGSLSVVINYVYLIAPSGSVNRVFGGQNRRFTEPARAKTTERFRPSSTSCTGHLESIEPVQMTKFCFFGLTEMQTVH